MTDCPATGYLTVGGQIVGMLRCSLEEGHEVPRTLEPDPHTLVLGATRELVEVPGVPHRAVLEWQDDATLAFDWPEAYDPDETFDTEVPDAEEPGA